MLHVLPLGKAAPLHPGLSDSFHAPGFIVLTVFVFLLLRRHRQGWFLYLATAAVVGGVAVLGELLQQQTGRDASFDDLGRDLVGTVSTLAITAAFDLGARPARVPLWPAALLLVGVPGIYFSVQPIFSIVNALYQRAASVPVLFNFEHAWQRHFIRSVGAAKLEFQHQTVAADGGHSAALLITPSASAKFSGVAFAPYADWTGHGTLAFRVRGGGAPFDVTVRVHDRAHNNTYADRYNRIFHIGATPARISIPLGDIERAPADRRLDLSNVDELILFVTEPSGQEQLEIDDIELTDE